MEKTVGKYVLTSIVFISLLFGSLLAVIPSKFASGDELDPATSSDVPTALNSSVKLMKRIDRVSIRTQTEQSHNQHIIEYNGTIYYVYAWFNSSTITLSMFVSSDGGRNWTSKLDVWSSNSYSDCFCKELLVWKGDLYVFFGGYHSTSGSRRLFMKKAPIGNWQNLRTASIVNVGGGGGHSFSLTYDNDYIYLGQVIASQWRSNFYRYDGSSWSSAFNIAGSNQGSNCEIQAIDMGAYTKLLFFYARPNSPGYVYMKTSTTQGTTWSSATTIMDRLREYQQISCIDINGTLLLFACQSASDDIDMVISRDNGTSWSSELTVISQRGASAYLYGKYGFHVGTRNNGKTVVLSYEGSTETIKMIYSEDWGSNWLSESKAVTIHSPNSFNPILSLEAKYLSYEVVNGSSYNVELVNLTQLFFDDFSPKNLSIDRGYFYMNLSWEKPTQKAFDNYTFQNYQLFRGTSSNSMSLYKTLGNVTFFNDTILSFDPVRFYYSISATFSIIGQSRFSNRVNGIHLIPPPPGDLRAEEGDLMVNISWGPLFDEVVNIYPVAFFTIYRGNYPDSLFPVSRIYDGLNYNDSDIDNYPANYHYRVTYTLVGVGEGKPSDPIIAKPNTMPDPPQNLSFKDIVEGVTISWDPSKDNGNLAVLEYIVYRGDHKDELQEIARLEGSTLSLDQTDLISGKDQFYSVAAVNRLGISMKTEPIMISYIGKTSRPEDLMANPKTMSIEIFWKEPAVTWGLPISWYYIYKGTSPGSTTLYMTVGGSETSLSDMVTPGIEYFYEVSAVNNFGESQRTGPVSATASRTPGPVTSISVSIGNGEISLDWGMVEGDGGASINFFTIYRSVDIETPKKIVVTPSGSLSYRNYGLENGQEYFYWITASNENGEGPLSNPVAGTPGKDPFAVSDISIKPTLYGAELFWKSPRDGGRYVFDYHIYRGRGPHSLHYLTNVSSMDEQDLSFNDQGLTYGITYFYSITAVNSLGESRFSPIVSTEPFGVPEAPTILTVEGLLDEISLAWMPPEDTGGLPLTGFVIHYREVGSTVWARIEVDTTILYSHISGLYPGRTMEVMISASNTLAEGTPSETEKVMIGDVPGRDLSIGIIPKESGCAISWEQPTDNGYPITHFMIYMVDEGGYPVEIGMVDGSIFTYEVEGLLNGVEYTFRLKAANIIGEGGLSDPEIVIPGKVPTKVDGLYVEETGDGFIGISWVEPRSNGGSKILEYWIYRGSSSGTETLIATISSDRLEFRDENVVNGESYFYSISAVNIIGEGAISNRVIVVPVGLPSAPLLFKATATTDSVTLSWESPIDTGGEPILGYLIYKGSKEGDLEVWKYLSPKDDSVTDEDVTKGRYMYKIHAYNSRGVGESNLQEVEIPSRILSASLISIFLFIIPLMIVLGVLLVPLFIRKNTERKERKALEEMAIQRAEIERSSAAAPPIGRPGLSASLGMRPLPPFAPPFARTITPPAQIQKPSVQPPERRLPPGPPTQVQRMPEGYIRPQGSQPRGYIPSFRKAPAPAAPVGPPNMKERSVVTEISIEPPMEKTVDIGPRPAVVNELLEKVVEPPEPPKDEKVFHEDSRATWSPEMVESRRTSEAKTALQMLQEITELREKGAITEEEFNNTKKHLLRKI